MPAFDAKVVGYGYHRIQTLQSKPIMDLLGLNWSYFILPVTLLMDQIGTNATIISRKLFVRNL